MASRTHLHDSAGRNITSGHRYKIRLVGSGSELFLAEPSSPNERAFLQAGSEGAGIVFYIDDATGRTRRRCSCASTQPSGRCTRSPPGATTSCGRSNWGTAASDGGLFGISGGAHRVFLARSSQLEVQINQRGRARVEVDLVGALLEVRFVRLPELEAET